MTLSDRSTSDRVRGYLASRAHPEPAFRALVGDASNRAYFRIGTGASDRAILALLPEPFVDEELPFLNVARLFTELSIRVPRILATSGAEGIVVLEDLGDILLQDAVADATVDEKARLYREAIDIIVRLQLGAERLATRDFVPFEVRFDEAKFLWELDFFRKYFLERLRGRTIEPDERNLLSETFHAIARELCTLPFVVCHRDFHARNLMLFGGELAVIDFQDARLGPRAYDVVSLLGDSYVRNAPELVEEMVARYEEATGSTIREEYGLVALQRNLKALGTFGFQIAERGNDVYAPYLRPTLELVDANLARGRRFDDLRRILSRHCEEIEG